MLSIIVILAKSRIFDAREKISFTGLHCMLRYEYDETRMLTIFLAYKSQVFFSAVGRFPLPWIFLRDCHTHLVWVVRFTVLPIAESYLGCTVPNVNSWSTGTCSAITTIRASKPRGNNAFCVIGNVGGS